MVFLTKGEELMSQNEKLEILTQLFQNLSESEKTSFLVKVLGQSASHSNIHAANTQTKSSLIQSQRKTTVCPVCGSAHAVRNGWKRGAQRYLCRECGKSFGDTEDTIWLYWREVLIRRRLKINLDLFCIVFTYSYFELKLEGTPVRKNSNTFGFSLTYSYLCTQIIYNKVYG